MLVRSTFDLRRGGRLRRGKGDSNRRTQGVHGIVAGIVQVAVLEAKLVEHGAQRARIVRLHPHLVERL